MDDESSWIQFEMNFSFTHFKLIINLYLFEMNVRMMMMMMMMTWHGIGATSSINRFNTFYLIKIKLSVEEWLYERTNEKKKFNCFLKFYQKWNEIENFNHSKKVIMVIRIDNNPLINCFCLNLFFWIFMNWEFFSALIQILTQKKIILHYKWLVFFITIF